MRVWEADVGSSTNCSIAGPLVKWPTGLSIEEFLPVRYGTVRYGTVLSFCMRLPVLPVGSTVLPPVPGSEIPQKLQYITINIVS